MEYMYSCRGNFLLPCIIVLNEFFLQGLLSYAFLNLCLFWNILTFWSVWKAALLVITLLVQFCFRAWNILFHAFLFLSVPVKDLSFFCYLCLCVWVSVFFSVTRLVLYPWHLDYYISWKSSLARSVWSLKAFCIWMPSSVSRFGSLSVIILLNSFCISLAFISTPSSIP